MKNTIFGMSATEFKRQCSIASPDCDTNASLTNCDTIDPCINGGKKILADPLLKEQLRLIYIGDEVCSAF